ncbi:MAG: hypothetical protein QM704_25570 [Anaeromyxobacteraceae bacterium]
MPSATTTLRGAEPAVLLLAAVGVVAIHALAGSPVELHVRLLAAALGVLACLLWWRFLATSAAPDAAQQGPFPFLPYALTQLYLYWAFATVTVTRGSLPPVSPAAYGGAVLAALVVALGVLLAFPAGRDVGARTERALDRCLPARAPALNAFVLAPWLAVCAVVQADVVAQAVPGSAYFLVKTLGDPAPLLAAIAWRDLRTASPSRTLALSAGVLSVAGLLSGMLEAAVQPLLTAAILQLVFRRRLPWRLVVAGAAVILVVNPAKYHYRELAWEEVQSRDERAAKDPLLAIRQWGEAIRMAWAEGPAERQRNASGVASRLDELSMNAVVLQATPSAVPFDGGVTWPEALLSVVPRFLHPGKPSYTELYNDRFSVTFGLQSRDSTATSTGAFPLVADGYWNFGWPGVVFVGLAAGWIFGFFAGALRARSWAAAAIGTSIFVQLHANNPLALQVIGVLQRVLGLALVLWLVSASSRLLEDVLSALRRPVRG